MRVSGEEWEKPSQAFRLLAIPMGGLDALPLQDRLSAQASLNRDAVKSVFHLLFTRAVELNSI